MNVNKSSLINFSNKDEFSNNCIFILFKKLYESGLMNIGSLNKKQVLEFFLKNSI